MRFATIAVAVCVLVIGCSDERVSVAEEPAQVGFTGVDEPVPQDGRAARHDLAADDAEEEADESAGERAGSSDSKAVASQGVKLFPEVLSETPSDAEEASVMRVLSLDAAEAVRELHSQGFNSQEACGAPSFIPDYAEAEEVTYAVITDENAALTARDVANAVWEYYAVVAQTHEQPAPQGLLCLSQVAMLPKLEWKWADLRDLVADEASVSYLLPQRVHVVGLMNGNASAVACLPPVAYGELSLNDAPIAAALLLQWAGGRWRVSVAEDSAAEVLTDYDNDFCDRLVQTQRAEFADDVADTGERWRFGPWSFTADENFTADELSQTAIQEVQQ